MRSGNIPFKFDVGDLLAKAKRQFVGRVGEVTINLPFVSFSVNPKDQERRVARELVIRLKDRRVLSSQECCDGCIDRSLASLQKIRETLTEKQVELAEFQDGPLFLMLEAIAAGIRQFMTFEELLQRDEDQVTSLRREEFYRPPDKRQAYFDALEILRGHIGRCIEQIAAIGGVPAPNGDVIGTYRGAWQIESYKAAPMQISDGGLPE